MVGLVLIVGLAMAQEDRFGFLPAGGTQLLERVLGACQDCGGLEDLSQMERAVEDWKTYLDEHGAMAEFTEEEIATLTRYLAGSFPTEAPIEDISELPADGRTIVIFQCQICHSIAIPMQEDRDVGYWLGHRTRPPHDALELTEREWTMIANYLALNAPIPEDTIPEELRRGAGGY